MACIPLVSSELSGVEKKAGRRTEHEPDQNGHILRPQVRPSSSGGGAGCHGEDCEADAEDGEDLADEPVVGDEPREDGRCRVEWVRC